MQIRRGRYRDLDARRARPISLFANAVFQWLPDHPAVLRRLLEALPPGGVLAVQMPDNTREPAHVLQREVAESGRGRPTRRDQGRRARRSAAARDLLRSAQAASARISTSGTASTITSWRAPQAIVEWFKGSSLQPFLSPLDAGARQKFLAAYTEKIVGAYKPRFDGKVLLRFPRLFIVAVR